MTDLTIPNLEEGIERFLRTRAAQHGVSLEDEARAVLREAAGSVTSKREDSRPATANPPAGQGPWRLRASREEILALGRKPEQPFDQKKAFDELYDYLEQE